MKHVISVSVLSWLGQFAQAPAVLAQSTEPTTRWYVEADAAYQNYALPETIWGNQRNSVFTLLPVQLRVGHRFRDGMVLEASVLYRRRNAPFTIERTYDWVPEYRYFQTTSAVETWAIPVTVQMPLLQRNLAASRWELGGKWGLTLVTSNFQFQKSTVNTRFSTSDYTDGVAQPRTWGDLPMMLGLHSGYRIGRHSQLTAGANVNFSYLLIIGTMFGSDASLLGGGGGLGWRYNF